MDTQALVYSFSPWSDFSPVVSDFYMPSEVSMSNIKTY
jgi:hypothetical protein